MNGQLSFLLVSNSVAIDSAFALGDIAIKEYMILAIVFIFGMTLLNNSCAKIPRPFKEFREHRYEKQERRRDRWQRCRPFERRDKTKSPAQPELELQAITDPQQLVCSESSLTIPKVFRQP